MVTEDGTTRITVPLFLSDLDGVIPIMVMDGIMVGGTLIMVMVGVTLIMDTAGGILIIHGTIPVVIAVGTIITTIHTTIPITTIMDQGSHFTVQTAQAELPMREARPATPEMKLIGMSVQAIPLRLPETVPRPLPFRLQPRGLPNQPPGAYRQARNSTGTPVLRQSGRA